MSQNGEGTSRGNEHLKGNMTIRGFSRTNIRPQEQKDLQGWNQNFEDKGTMMGESGPQEHA